MHWSPKQPLTVRGDGFFVTANPVISVSNAQSHLASHRIALTTLVFP
jgi:hypothetical protein